MNSDNHNIISRKNSCNEAEILTAHRIQMTKATICFDWSSLRATDNRETKQEMVQVSLSHVTATATHTDHDIGR